MFKGAINDIYLNLNFQDSFDLNMLSLISCLLGPEWNLGKVKTWMLHWIIEPDLKRYSDSCLKTDNTIMSATETSCITYTPKLIILCNLTLWAPAYTLIEKDKTEIKKSGKYFLTTCLHHLNELGSFSFQITCFLLLEITRI